MRVEIRSGGEAGSQSADYKAGWAGRIVMDGANGDCRACSRDRRRDTAGDTQVRTGPNRRLVRRSRGPSGAPPRNHGNAEPSPWQRRLAIVVVIISIFLGPDPEKQGPPPAARRPPPAAGPSSIIARRQRPAHSPYFHIFIFSHFHFFIFS